MVYESQNSSILSTQFNDFSKFRVVQPLPQYSFRTFPLIPKDLCCLQLILVLPSILHNFLGVAVCTDLFFWTFHTNGITQYVFLCVLLSIWSLRLIHVIAGVSN